jgi:hypothetical protein
MSPLNQEVVLYLKKGVLCKLYLITYSLTKIEREWSIGEAHIPLPEPRSDSMQE